MASKALLASEANTGYYNSHKNAPSLSLEALTASPREAFSYFQWEIPMTF